jgi:hypothetical protein
MIIVRSNTIMGVGRELMTRMKTRMPLTESPQSRPSRIFVIPNLNSVPHANDIDRKSRGCAVIEVVLMRRLARRSSARSSVLKSFEELLLLSAYSMAEVYHPKVLIGDQYRLDIDRE